MTSKLKILHLEDSVNDAELVARSLKRSDLACEIKLVSDKNGFEDALQNYHPDLILSDHTMPQFNSLEALQLVKSAKEEIPFILVTGTVSEEFAVACIEHGVDDYILKSNLIRLPNAIRHAMNEKEALNKLRTSEERYRQIVETAQEGIWMFNRDFETIFANRKMCDILEYSQEEMMGKTHSWFIDEGSKLMVIRAIQSNVSENTEFRCITKSGRQIWLQISTSPLVDRNKEFIGMLGMVTDVTDQKEAHEKLVRSEVQIRNFAKYLNQTMEEVSSRIAREIHDELGQQLAGIKMALASLKKTGDQASREEKIDGIVADVDGTIQSVRKIATELRPGILDSLGLIPSIEWMVNEFQRKAGIRCVTDIEVKEQKFDKDISICFFRVCQESLTNISKHAQASEVKVKVYQNEKELLLVISDNGKGMAEEKLENPFSMGLLGMRERASIIGGDLQIISRENEGTTVQLKVSIN